MKRTGFAVLTLALCQSVGASEALYFPCQSCHGDDGSGNEGLDAPAIAGMDASYVAKQIAYFRDGIRGSTLDDLRGRQMGLISAILKDDEDVRVLAEYVEAMPRVKPLATLPSPGAEASQLYEACSVCHGPNGEGVSALDGPAISWLDDWYIRHQLQNYKDGVRGSDARDPGGSQMRASVAALSDNDMDQLAAFVVTLSGESNED